MYRTTMAAGILLMSLGFATTAIAGGGASSVAPGKNKEALIDFYGSDPDVGSPTPSGHVTTLGGAISGGFYGNTSNSGDNTEDAPDRGHGVTPSQSPGPQTTNPPQGPGEGTSIGDAIQAARP